MAAPERPAARPVNLTRLLDMHAKGEKIAALCVSDATWAVAASRAGVECLLIGKDMASGYEGHADGTHISLDALVYHVGNAARGLRVAQASAWLVSDMPSASSGLQRELAVRNASALLQAGAQMVRMAVDAHFLETAQFLTERGIAVCGLLEKLSSVECARAALAMQAANVPFAVLQDMGDAAVAEFAKTYPQCITLGANSARPTSGQLLSMQTLMGLGGEDSAGTGASYVSQAGSIGGALERYVADVKAGGPILLHKG